MLQYYTWMQHGTDGQTDGQQPRLMTPITWWREHSNDAMS